MNWMRRVMALLPIIGVSLLVPAARPQKSTPAVSDRELQRRSFALNFLHALNAAEFDYKKNHGAFANWDTLFATGYFSETGTKWGSEDFPTVTHAMYSRAREIVPGWKLRLNVSNDGKSYDALLEDATDPKCGYAGVTDEQGVIRQSKFINCQI
jgi:hypothetical protein